MTGSNPAYMNSRPGAAMLLVLVAIAIVVPAGAAALRLASMRASESSDALDEERARIAALVIEPALLAWASDPERNAPLRPEMSDEVAPSIDPSGFVRVLELSQSDGTCLVVDAIDLSGRLDIEMLDSLARNGLPPPLGQLTSQDFRPPGRSNEALVYPEAISAAATKKSGSFVHAWPRREGDRSAAAIWLRGIDRARPDQQGASPESTEQSSVNIHSAPIELLRAALVGYDPGLARAAIEHRERGERIPQEIAASLVAASRRGSSGRSFADGSRLTPLTDKSDAYGFLVTWERGPVRTSWWIVAERGAPPVTRPDGRSQPGPRAASRGTNGRSLTGWWVSERRRVYP